MKRIVLFLLTNLAVMVVIGVVCQLTGLNRFIGSNGLELVPLLGYAAVVGFTGAFISLLMSKPMAKWSTGAQVIETPSNADEQWLVNAVAQHAKAAGIAMPEVAIYEGEPNAFATGAFRNSALVAVSTGLLHQMTHEEIDAVLAHEVAHVANGDMVTLTLVQGVVNTFVIFLSRVIAYAVDNALRGRNSNQESHSSSPGMTYYIVSMVLDLVFGILASIIVAWVSRKREFRADAGAAEYMRNPAPMIKALQRLQSLQPGVLPKSVAALGIAGGLGALFSTHPPLEERIARLSQQR